MNCRHCGFESSLGNLFCISCGRPLSETRSAPVIHPDNPFHRIRARSLVLWVLAGIPIVVGMFVLANLFVGRSDGGLDPFFQTLIINAGFYGLMVAWVLGKASGNRVDMRLLIGCVPSGYRWRSVVGVVGLLMLFTIFTSWLFLYFISAYLTHLVDVFATEDVYVTGKQSDYAGLHNAQAFVVTVLVAPVVEEVFFRGMLLTRWSLKWGPTAGVIGSSIVFGLFHVGFFGAFAFGVAMCLLYIKTSTLIVPMAAHFLNNLVASGFSAIAIRSDAEGRAVDFQDLETGLMVAVAGAIVTLTLLVWYIVRNWPRRGETAPYLVNQVWGE